MCEANAYLVKDGREELIMQSVDVIEPEKEDVWRLVNIFGDQKIIKGHIQRMNLVDHRILFKESSQAGNSKAGPTDPSGETTN